MASKVLTSYFFLLYHIFMERASMKIGVQHQGRRNNQTDVKNVKKQLIKENISQKTIFNR